MERGDGNAGSSRCSQENTRGRGGEERRRYKAMTIMAVESAADVHHGGGGGERESYHPASVFTRHF